MRDWGEKSVMTIREISEHVFYKTGRNNVLIFHHKVGSSSPHSLFGVTVW